MYADPEDLKYANTLGYTHTRGIQNGSRFEKEDRHIWSTWNGWQTADLVGHRYMHHKMFDHLRSALGRPL